MKTISPSSSISVVRHPVASNLCRWLIASWVLHSWNCIMSPSIAIFTVRMWQSACAYFSFFPNCFMCHIWLPLRNINFHHDYPVFIGTLQHGSYGAWLNQPLSHDRHDSCLVASRVASSTHPIHLWYARRVSFFSLFIFNEHYSHSYHSQECVLLEMQRKRWICWCITSTHPIHWRCA